MAEVKQKCRLTWRRILPFDLKCIVCNRRQATWKCKVVDNDLVVNFVLCNNCARLDPDKILRRIL